MQYAISWWPLDFIAGEKLWTDDAGKPLYFQDRGDAAAHMFELYANPDYQKLGFRIVAVQAI